MGSPEVYQEPCWADSYQLRGQMEVSVGRVSFKKTTRLGGFADAPANRTKLHVWGKNTKQRVAPAAKGKAEQRRV